MLLRRIWALPLSYSHVLTDAVRPCQISYDKSGDIAGDVAGSFADANPGLGQGPVFCFYRAKQVHVYYPPMNSSNTWCVADNANVPSPTIPPGLVPEPSSAYVVISTIEIDNSHTRYGPYTSRTFTFGPGQLSTVVGPPGPGQTTRAFDFTDLPCGPHNAHSEVTTSFSEGACPNPKSHNHTCLPISKKPYLPELAPFPQLMELDHGGNSGCIGFIRLTDPPLSWGNASGPTIPHKDQFLGPLGHRHLHHREHHEHHGNHEHHKDHDDLGL